MRIRFFTCNFIVALTVSLSLTGCISSGSKYQPIPTPAPHVQFQPQANISHLGGSASQLAGQYHGLFACDAELAQFQLDLKKEDNGGFGGKLTRVTIAGGRPARKGQPVAKTTADVKGLYDPVTSSFSLTVRAQGNGAIHGVHARFVQLHGLMMPDANLFVVYDMSPFGMRCSPWVAQRGKRLSKDWQFVAQVATPDAKMGIIDKFQLQREMKKDRERQDCDPKLVGWLDSTAQLPRTAKPAEQSHFERLLYTDGIFARHFGKSFFELEPLERKVIETRLQGSCQREYARRMRTNRNTQANWRIAIASFPANSQVSDAEKAVSAIALKIEDNWRKLARLHLDYMAAHQGEPDFARSFIKPGRLFLKTMLPEQRDEFIHFALIRLKKMIIVKLDKELARKLTSLPGTLETLNTLAKFAPRSLQRNPEIDASDITNLVNRADTQLRQASVAATHNYAAALSGIDGVRAVDNWNSHFVSLTAKLSEDDIQKMNQILAQRRGELAQQLLVEERRRFSKQVVTPGETIKALLASTQYENDFIKKYEMLADAKGYPEFAAERRVLRNRLLASTHTRLASIIRNWEHARILKQQTLRYLLPEDQQSSSGKKIHAVLEKQRHKVAPFGEGNYNAYLNALYTYDDEFLRRADRISILPVAQAMYAMQPLLGGLEKIFFGEKGMRGTGRTQIDIEMGKLRESSLIYPLMAYYLMNYQHYNKHCIKNPVKREVHSLWVETLNDVVVDSDHSVSVYLIDQRFNSIFSEIFDKNPDRVTSKMIDRFFKSKGKIYRDELVEGTKQLLQKNCKDPVIRKLEGNMIRYFAGVKKRIDAVH